MYVVEFRHRAKLLNQMFGRGIKIQFNFFKHVTYQARGPLLLGQMTSHSISTETSRLQFFALKKKKKKKIYDLNFIIDLA